MPFSRRFAELRPGNLIYNYPHKVLIVDYPYIEVDHPYIGVDQA